MKMVQAIIRREKLGEVKKALEAQGIIGLNVTEVQGRGRQKGQTRQWRGAVYDVDLLPKIKLETVVDDKDLDKAIDTILGVTSTGNFGDGKIFVWTVDDAIRASSKERGTKAL
jgi:nitrogen regulatory protein P-II 1